MVNTKTLIVLSISASTAHAFAPSRVPKTNQLSTMIREVRHNSELQMSKGFGPAKETPREKSSGQMKREEQSSKYDEIAKSGGQQYNVFVRQFGSDDNSWFPCGSIAVPRGAQVSDAIFANEQGLKEAIVRMYPKLRGFEEEFEFGYNLKIYMDDPVEVATKRVGGGKSDGPSLGNWISNLLSPIDASQVGKN